MGKPTYRSPADVADELVKMRLRAFPCDDCEEFGQECLWHAGYREGCLTLLLKATVR